MPLALLCSTGWVHAQVVLEGPIRLTGPDAERGVDGIAAPSSEHAVITVHGSLVGTTTWAEASNQGTEITLVPAAPLATHRNGQLLRFLAPADIHGATTIRCTGLPPLPLLRPDGLVPALGQIRQGAVMEVIHVDGAWIMMNAPERGCPPGTVAIGDRLCMEANDADNLFYYPAADRCTGLGGRLCSWDEFYIACTQHAAAMSGLLDAWEWIDDSSNHANSAVQVGLGSCTAQRWANPQSVTLGHSRCCFQPR